MNVKRYVTLRCFYVTCRNVTCRTYVVYVTLQYVTDRNVWINVTSWFLTLRYVTWGWKTCIRRRRILQMLMLLTVVVSGHDCLRFRPLSYDSAVCERCRIEISVLDAWLLQRCRKSTYGKRRICHVIWLASNYRNVCTLRSACINLAFLALWA